MTWVETKWLREEGNGKQEDGGSRASLENSPVFLLVLGKLIE